MNIKVDSIKVFIATYLIPAYEREYVDSKLRRDFYKIVDEAEKEYREDN
jgi:hypothetical protein